MTSPGLRRTVAALALVLTGALGPPSPRADEASGLALMVSEGRVSLDAREVPLQAILNEIGERTGIRVRFEERGGVVPADELVTATIHDRPVEEALRQLLRGRNVVFVYSPSELAEARVYGRGEPGASAGSPPAANLRSMPAPAPAAAAAPPATAPDAGAASPEAPPVAPQGAGAPPAAAPPADVPPGGGPLAATAPGDAPSAAVPGDPALARLRSDALENADPAVRGRALDALAASADRARARAVLVEALGRESDPALRIKALTYLGAEAASDPRARQALEASAAQDPAPVVRDAARGLLQQLAPR